MTRSRQRLRTTIGSNPLSQWKPGRRSEPWKKLSNPARLVGFILIAASVTYVGMHRHPIYVETIPQAPIESTGKPEVSGHAEEEQQPATVEQTKRGGYNQRTRSGDQKNDSTYDEARLCLENPYASSIERPLSKIGEDVDRWLSMLPDYHRRASKPRMRKRHNRFFPFHKFAPCSNVSCVGGNCGGDTSKVVCGLEKLQEHLTCQVYSIGGNNQWEFENDIIKKTPCNIHTFDCTGKRSRFNPPNHERMHFHHFCLGAQHESGITAQQDERCGDDFELGEGMQLVRDVSVKCGDTLTLLEIQKRLNHTRIDLLKMDIEGFEWPIFNAWPELTDPASSMELVLPMQVLVEVHYKTQFDELTDENTVGKPGKWDFRTADQMVNLAAHLHRTGYAVTERDDNNYCPHCTELTLTRFRCPNYQHH